MHLKAVYTVEAALIVPIILVTLMGVFQVSGDLYREGQEITKVLEQRKLKEAPVKAIRNSYFLKQVSKALR